MTFVSHVVIILLFKRLKNYTSGQIGSRVCLFKQVVPPLMGASFPPPWGLPCPNMGPSLSFFLGVSHSSFLKCKTNKESCYTYSYSCKAYKRLKYESYNQILMNINESLFLSRWSPKVYLPPPAIFLLFLFWDYTILVSKSPLGFVSSGLPLLFKPICLSYPLPLSSLKIKYWRSS